MKRRELLAVSLCLLGWAFLTGMCIAAQPRHPNILWLTAEDHGPHLGCYGDRYATTPNLDALAARGMIYRRCWSVVPVCAPARTTIITGLFPSSTGAEHMRSSVRLPDGFAVFPQLLRAAGYYCSNNSKEDYNVVASGQVWDESSAKAHWKNRQQDQPFFAVFNFTDTHESQIRKRPHTAVHDPAGVRVPAYHPDVPEVRQDWAQYYDQLSVADAQVGKHLAELDEAGLSDDTIVFYFADHGPGLPRCKRSACDSGLRVPLIVHAPQKWRELAPSDYQVGSTSERLVSFVDLAPTVLSLADVKPPEHLQGTAIAGKYQQPGPAYLHGLRGRMDERYDLVRSVTDGRYVYVWNYRPELPAGQHVEYMFATPTTQVWKKLFDEGKLNLEQARFWQPRTAEELYDLEHDPDEVHNLAGSGEHTDTLLRLRVDQRSQVMRVRDLGLMPEAEMHRRSGDDAPWTMGHDEKRYPLRRVLEVAELASKVKNFEGPKSPPAINAIVSMFRPYLNNDDACVRYWCVIGLRHCGREAMAEAHDELEQALSDESPSVQIAAAETLRSAATLEKVLSEHADNLYVVLEALNAVDHLHLNESDVPSLAKLAKPRKSWEPRATEGVAKLLRAINDEP